MAAKSTVPRVQWPVRLSSKPKYAPLIAPLSQYNARILQSAEKGDLAQALRLARELRETYGSTVKPDANTYEALAKGFAAHGLADESLRLVEDAKALGFDPDVSLWNQVLRAHIAVGRSPTPVLYAMAEASVKSNALTSHLLIQQFAQQRNLEAALGVLFSHLGASNSESTSTTTVPRNTDLSSVPIESITCIIKLAAQSGEIRLALDLLERYERGSPRRFPEDVYLLLHSACIAEGNADIGAAAFERIKLLKIELTEGTIIESLNLFGSNGFPDQCEYLISDILPRTLRGLPLREWHVAPLVTAHMLDGNLKAALQAFGKLKHQSTSKSDSGPSYKPYLAGMRGKEGVESMIQQFWRLLEAEREPDLILPVQLTNALLQACSNYGLRDEQERISQAALASRAESAEPSRIRPDMETFNILLRSCVGKGEGFAEEEAFSDIRRAEELLGKIKSDFSDLVTNVRTYEALIDIYLHSDDTTWELAFDYLEEMKHHDILPPPSVYNSFLLRLLEVEKTVVQPTPIESTVGDSRIDMILHEMASLGYLGGPDDKRAKYRMVLNRPMIEKVGKHRIQSVMNEVQWRAKQQRRRKPMSR